MIRFACYFGLGSAVLLLSGCGPKYIEVKGVLKMDGAPVEGATVTFVSEKGEHSFSGSTNAGGEFSLTGGEKPGALPGNYKILVVKSPREASAEAVDPTESMKLMKKDSEESAKAGGAGGASDPRAKMMMGKMGGGGGPPAAPTLRGGVVSALPKVYASFDTTPLSAKVPPDTQPVAVDIKSKP